MRKPTFSVLIPNYNHAKYVGQALQAVIDQSYRPIEIIVIDDASTDNSIGIIREFVEHDPIIRLVVNEKNMGVVHNLNKLLELANGDYVYFAAADDKILPGFFERSMNLLAQNPQTGLCSALTLIIDEENRNKGLHPTFIISRKECFVTPEKARRILKKAGNWIPGNTAILKRKALIDSGGFIPELHSFSDGFLYHAIALKYGFCFIPEPLACWRRMDSGYAMSTGSNPDIMNEITCHAVNLMQTAYSELFSKEYIKDFEKVQSILMKLNRISLLQNKEDNPDRHYSRLRLFLNKLLVSIKRLQFRVARLLYTIYLLLKFNPRVRPIIFRRLSMLSHFLIFYSSRKIKVN